MNISQHAFVPFGNVLDDKRYKTDPFTPIDSSSTFTTSMSFGIVTNSYQLFPFVAPLDYYILRCYSSAISGLVTGVGLGTISETILVTKKPQTCDKFAINGSTAHYGKDKRIPVLALGWYEY